MHNVESLIKELDFFGAVFKPSTSKAYKEHKTAFGGVISLLLFLASISYLIYNIVMWRIGMFLPTTVIAQQTLEKGLYTIDAEPLSIFCVDTYEKVDPFDPAKLILQSKLQIFKSGWPDEEIQLQFNKDNYLNFTSIVLPELTYKFDIDRPFDPSTKYLLQLQICQNQTAFLQNQTCATKDEIEQFLNKNTKFLSLTFYLRQFNDYTKQIEKFKYQHLFILDNSTVFYSQANTIVDDGFLFPSEHSETFNENIELLTQQINKQQTEEYIDQNTIFYLTLKLHPLKTIKNLQYLKFNELLAGVDSILSMVFYISIFAAYYNSVTLDQKIIEKVISFYYPSFNEIKITRSILGKFKKVQINEKSINVKSFEVFYEKAKRISEQKLTYLNMLYEISRLQFLIEHQSKERKLLLESHSFGIKIPEFPYEDEANQSHSEMPKIYINQNDQSKSEEGSILHTQKTQSNDKFNFSDFDFEILLEQSQQE